MLEAIATLSRLRGLESGNPGVMAIALAWETLEDFDKEVINYKFRAACKQVPSCRHVGELDTDMCNALQHIVFMSTGSMRTFYTLGGWPGTFTVHLGTQGWS